MPKSTITLFLTLLSVITIASFCKSPTENKTTDANNESDPTNYLQKGKGIAIETQKLLAKNLTTAITEGGTEFAIQFCNERASILSDSMSIQLNADIKRVSDQPRNTNNSANEKESTYIKSVKKAIQNGETVNPQIETTRNSVTGYYPIITNSLCLQCHGNKQTDITNNVQLKINSLYPYDKATGYSINQLRGIWVITIKKH